MNYNSLQTNNILCDHKKPITLSHRIIKHRKKNFWPINFMDEKLQKITFLCVFSEMYSTND